MSKDSTGAEGGSAGVGEEGTWDWAEEEKEGKRDGKGRVQLNLCYTSAFVGEGMINTTESRTVHLCSNCPELDQVA